jgi:hypothetical protein
MYQETEDVRRRVSATVWRLRQGDEQYTFFLLALAAALWRVRLKNHT